MANTLSKKMTVNIERNQTANGLSIYVTYTFTLFQET